MGNVLYWLAVFLVIAWLLGYFGIQIASGLIHILLVLAIVSVLLGIIRNGRF